MIMDIWALPSIDNPFISVALHFPKKGHMNHLTNSEYFAHLQGDVNSSVIIALGFFSLTNFLTLMKQV